LFFSTIHSFVFCALSCWLVGTDHHGTEATKVGLLSSTPQGFSPVATVASHTVSFLRATLVHGPGNGIRVRNQPVSFFRYQWSYWKPPLSVFSISASNPCRNLFGYQRGSKYIILWLIPQDKS
jgi:hypothetical protein